MNRGERREKSKRKWISRAKKFYYACQTNYWIPKEGIKANVPRIRPKRFFRKCESITDFLRDSIYAKLLKNCTKPERDVMNQIDDKIQNRKDRYFARKQINEGIEEYYDDSMTCYSCIYFNNEECQKGHHLLNGDSCPDYWD